MNPRPAPRGEQWGDGSVFWASLNSSSKCLRNSQRSWAYPLNSSTKHWALPRGVERGQGDKRYPQLLSSVLAGCSPLGCPSLEPATDGANPMDLLNPSPHARSVLLGDRQCTAMNRKGNRCGRASALGQFVCDHHGAKSPLSIQAGKERMATLVEPALDVLYRATRNAPPCEVCGRSDADRDPTAVRAAGMIFGSQWFSPDSRDPATAHRRV